MRKLIILFRTRPGFAITLSVLIVWIVSRSIDRAMMSPSDVYYPGATEVSFNGLKQFNYYVLLLFDSLRMYPIVDRVAFFVVFMNIFLTIFIVLMILGISNRRKRQNTRYVYFMRRYGSALKRILPFDHLLSASEIQSMLDWREVYMRQEDYEACLRVLRALRVELRVQVNIENISTVCDLTGLSNYIVKILTNGSRNQQVTVLQCMRQLQLNMPSSVVARLQNSRDRLIMASSRLYFIAVNEEDPFSVLDGNYLNENMTRFELMELHATLKQRHDANRQMPRFEPLIEMSDKLNIKRFMIEETGYWGDADTMEYVCNFLESKEEDFKTAACRAIAISKYTPAEKRLITMYDVSSSVVRLEILRAIDAIGSGNADDFFLRAYGISKTHILRREILRKMWSYSPQSHEHFIMLRGMASKEYLNAFYYIENEMKMVKKKEQEEAKEAEIKYMVLEPDDEINNGFEEYKDRELEDRELDLKAGDDETVDI